MGLQVKLAETSKEREAVYRLRYEIYVEEMNRTCKEVDHEKKMLYDKYDETAYIFYLTDGDEIIGTLRGNLLREGEIEFAKEYMVDKFGPYYPDRISTTSKLMIKKDFRKGRAVRELINTVFEFGIRQNIALDFINCNPPLVKFYRKIGYRLYRSNFMHPEFGEVVPMVLFMHDYKYLKEVNPAFYRIIRDSPFISSARENADNAGLDAAGIQDGAMNSEGQSCFSSWYNAVRV